jgi:hypothetical protein
MSDEEAPITPRERTLPRGIKPRDLEPIVPRPSDALLLPLLFSRSSSSRYRMQTRAQPWLVCTR